MLGDAVCAGVTAADRDGDAPVDGDALVGCALPPAQALAGVHGAHVPSVPEQKKLPVTVDA
jgi:hypothetical protein